MAPRTDFHRFWIDLCLILEWIFQVYFDRYCDEAESEFGFALLRGRKDAKLRSSEGMKARSRARKFEMAFVVTFDEAVQGATSRRRA